MVRLLRCGTARFLRAAELCTRLFGGMPWRIDTFNRLVEADVAAAAKTAARAEIVVGIPFHRETENIGRLIRMICRDLEARGERAAIVIVSERKTEQLLWEALRSLSMSLTFNRASSARRNHGPPLNVSI